MKRASASHWLRAVEAASLGSGAPPTPQALAAAARFDALASPAAGMALVREIVETRAAELTLAYRNVVMVTAGYRTRADANGHEHLHPEPCVIFVVRRKWARPVDGPAPQCLPARLLVHGGSGRARRLYAVPTDVQPADGWIGARVHASACVRLDDADPPFRLPGTLTCAVRAAVGSQRRLALSAMHVLNPVPAQPLPQGGVAFSDIGAGGQRRGESSDWGGQVNGSNGSAFDVQLAHVDDPAWFNTLYDGWSLSKARPFVRSPAELDELAATMRFQIVTPDNHPDAPLRPREPMLAQFDSWLHGNPPIEYQVRQGGHFDRVLLRHRLLFRLRVLADCPLPLSGDSGSPVMSWWPDGSNVLAGVFIASPSGNRHAWVLPAWEALDRANWSAPPTGAGMLLPDFRMS